MKNPLVLFVGAAVVAVAALAGVTADRWQDWPGPVQPSVASPDVVSGDAAEPAGEPESKLPPPASETAEPAPELRREQPAETLAGPAPQEPDEQVAAVGADEIESPEIAVAPVEEPAVALEVPTGELVKEPAEPERLAAVDAREVEPTVPSAPMERDAEAEAPAQPSFDVVRLTDDGSLVVAGLAAPGANVTLLLDGEAIASDAANDVGAWLLMPEAPLPPGSHQLMVQARDADSGAETSGTIAVAVPERAADRPRVAHSEPAQPPAAQDDVAVAPAPVEPGLAEREEPARLEPEELPVDEAEEEQVALAPVQEPDVEVAAPVVEETEPEAEPEEHAAISPEADVDPEPEPEAEIERRDIPLALETVDYNDAGEIVFSGRADPGGIVRVHVDNRFVGETTADADGRWTFAGGDRIAPGRHTLRADLMGADGNVVGRIILPFVRADGREVAALVEGRREAVVRRKPEVAPEAEAPEPAAPVVAEEIAPEPEPEAPAVVDVEPEPEPEAPAVVDVAPEPEPEAPVVAEDVAPEPEPEAPAVAEEVAPEPEPEAPVVAEEVAPEPEPEAPAVVDVEPEPEPEAPAVVDVAPEPEPEAPAVVDVAPEPEPEAPVVAEEVAPEPEPEAPAVVDVAPEPEPEAPAVVDVVPEPESEAPVVAEEVAPEPAPEADGRVAAVEPERIEPADTEPTQEQQAAENGEPDLMPVRPGHVVIQPGNNLWRISRVIYGRGIEYTAIYEANRDKIRDPDLIYPGQIFATPGVDPPREIDPERREPLSPEELARRNAAE
jgi:nucleoid-associated protein YgaU